MLVEDDPTHVLVWSEATAPERTYPNGIAATVAEHLNEEPDLVARAASIDDPDQGAPESALAWADAVAWWGHNRHDEVSDATVDRVADAVADDGVGFVGLHSGHYARPFTRLLGTSGDLGDVRRVDGETEQAEVRAPAPETVVFHSIFSESGEFRSGLTFEFGAGWGFYLRPGHETYRTYHHPSIRRILANAVRWVSE